MPTNGGAFIAPSNVPAAHDDEDDDSGALVSAPAVGDFDEGTLYRVNSLSTEEGRKEARSLEHIGATTSTGKLTGDDGKHRCRKNRTDDTTRNRAVGCWRGRDHRR